MNKLLPTLVNSNELLVHSKQSSQSFQDLKKQKNYEPTNQRGFTLIELLVVVAIIAILTIIAISTYSGLQKRGRDSVRRAEIDSLAKSIEVRKDASNGSYSYGADASGDITKNSYEQDYPTQNKKPQDPKGNTYYCYRTSTTATSVAPVTAAEWPLTVTCPTSWLAIPPAGTTSSPAGGYTIIAPSLTSPVKHWMICARLEATEEVFCKADLSN